MRYIESHAAKHLEPTPDYWDCAHFKTERGVKEGTCEMASEGKCPYLPWKKPGKALDYLL
jgi:hypothetical protein